MTTTIISNGSKWAGEAPDSIATLLDVLGTHALHRLFESHLGEGTGAFISVCQASEKWALPGTTRFHGNFIGLSHVFSIDTDDPDLIDRLTAAIKANVERPDYLSQPTWQQRQAAVEAHRAQQDAERQAHRIRAARATLGLAV